MKLNNRGWGLIAFLGFTCIFVVAIIIVSINAYKVGLTDKNISDVKFTDTSVYSNMEVHIVDGAKKYVSDGKCQFNNGICYVTSKQLINEGIINNLVDKNYTKCDGYVKVTNSSNPTYNGYVKCGSSYQTTGYVSEFAN